MAWTVDDLAALDQAIATGVRRIKFSDREMEFQNTADMLLARTEINNSLSLTSGVPQKRMVQMFTKNGW